MIDRAAIEAGKAAMKLELAQRKADGRVQLLGAYDRLIPAARMIDQTEIEGAIDIEELARAFMRGAGIREINEIGALQKEVQALREEVSDLKATMRLVPRPGETLVTEGGPEPLSPQRQAMRDRFKPLAPKADDIEPDLRGVDP